MDTQVQNKDEPVGSQPTPVLPAARLWTIVTFTGTALVVVPILTTFQLLGSVPLTQAVLTSIVISIQTLGGSLLWGWVRGQSTISWVEATAIGIPLGAVMSLLAFQALRPTPFSFVGWAIPTAALIFIYVIAGAGRIRVGAPARRDVIGLSVVVLSALMLATRVWYTTPLERDGWFALFGDIPIHEAMANTLALRGPGESLMLLDGNLRYHWFANAWAGTLSLVTNAGPFVTLTRSLFALAVLGAALLAWTLAPIFVKGWWARVGAGVTVFLGTTITIGFANPGSPILEKFSPTLTFGALSLLAVTFVIMRNLQSKTRPATLVAVAVLGVGVLGGRITLGIVAMGGVGAIALLALVLRARRWATVVNITALGVGFGASYFLLTSQEPIATQVNPWVIDPNIEVGQLWSLIPFYNQIGYAMAVVAVIAIVAAQASGLLWNLSLPDGLRNPANYWVLGTLIFGFLGVFLTRQLGYAQMTLLGSAIIPALVASGAGLGSALEYLRRQVASYQRWISTVSTGLVAVLLLSLVTISATPFLIGFRYYGPTRWILPFAVWLTAAMLGISLLWLAKAPRTRLNILAAGVAVLVSTTLATPIWQIAQQIRVDTGVFTTANANIMTMDDFEAAQWIQDNTPEDSVWATNRMCSVVGDVPPECPSTGYVISALAKRQALIEGHTYSIGADLVERADEFSWAIARIMNSYEFGKEPSADNAQYLWNQGVRYFWVDTAVENAGDWSTYADIVFTNPRAVILQLKDPSEISR